MCLLLGTAVTNVIHCIVILVALFAVGVVGVREFGAWEVVTQQVNAGLAQTSGGSVRWWAFTGGGMSAILAMFFSATIHSPAASIYANYYGYAERAEPRPGLHRLWSHRGADADLGGYRRDSHVRSVWTEPGIGRLPQPHHARGGDQSHSGGVALAAVLAAVISSGGPILVSSATMFVRDWMPWASKYSSDRRLRSYQRVTVCYALISALIAWWIATGTTVSILDMLLFAFAMVVPAAISVSYVLYWRRATEPGAYWGMLAGYAAGGVWFLLIKWALWTELQASPTAFPIVRLAASLLTANGEGLDPAYVTTLVPLIVVPAVSLYTDLSSEREAAFRARLASSGPGEIARAPIPPG